MRGGERAQPGGCERAAQGARREKGTGAGGGGAARTLQPNSLEGQRAFAGQAGHVLLPDAQQRVPSGVQP